MSQLILKIRLRHQFFQSQQLEGFSLVATPATAQLLQRYQLFLRQTEDGYDLYSQASQPEVLLAYLAEQYQGQPLNWNLQGDLNFFYSISDLPADQTARFIFELPAKSCTSPAASATSATQDLLVRMSTATALPDGVLGQLRCEFSQVLQACLTQATYQYEFQARKLHWIYFLINRSQLSLQQARITQQDQVAFTEPELTRLPSGESALKFSALTDFYLFKQRDQPVFDLQVAALSNIEGQRQYQVLLKGLPTPQVRQLSIRRQSGSSIVSNEMYVYL